MYKTYRCSRKMGAYDLSSGSWLTEKQVACLTALSVKVVREEMIEDCMDLLETVLHFELFHEFVAFVKLD